MLDRRMFTRSVAVIAALALCAVAAHAGPGTREYSGIGEPTDLDSSSFGAAVVVQRYDVHVGAPSADGIGRVFSYSRFDGDRRLRDAYVPEGLPVGAQFGACMAVGTDYEDSGVVVGAPGMRSAFVLNSVGSPGMVSAFRIDGPDGVENDSFADVVASARDSVIVGAYQSEGAGRVYTYVRGPRDAGGESTWLPGDVLAGNDELDAEFGATVAADRDTLVVGAPGESVDETAGAGAIYVYTRESSKTGSRWELAQRIPSPATTDSVGFGMSVDVLGDRIIVAAPRFDDGDVEHAGAFWTFVRDDDGEWSEEDFETDPTPTFEGAFGSVVQLGAESALVSAGGDRVERFVLGDDGFAHESTIASPADGSSMFGASLAIAAPHVLIGAPAAGTTGELYAMTPVGSLDTPSAQPGDRLGWDVAVSGGVAVVTAPFADGSAEGAGVAHVLQRDELGRWARTQSLTRDTTDTNEELGYSAAIAGPVLAVAVKGLRDEQRTAVGGFVVYRPGESGWEEEAVVRAEGAAGGSQFGYSIDTDGRTIVVGARDHTAGASRSGAAFVFERVEGTWTQVAELHMPKPSANAFFGLSVGVEGDWIVVGAPRAVVDSVATGAAYTYERTDDGWEARHTLVARAAAAGSNCGTDVAIGAERILVSARTQFAPQLSWGAFAYYLDQGDWNPLHDPIHAPGRGVTISSLDIDGTSAAVGVVSGEGRQVWLCRRDARGLEFERRITLGVPAAPGNVNQFGESVAISCNDVVVGDPILDGNTGAAFAVGDALDAFDRLELDGPRSYQLLAGEPVDIRIRVSGGAPPYTFGVGYGDLPDGLTLEPTTGRLSGTPTAPATDGRSTGLEAVDVCGRREYINLTVVPRLAIPDTLLLPAVIGRPFSQLLNAGSGLGSPTFEVIAGGFAPGVKLSEDGWRLIGTPTEQGRFSVTLRATDDSGDVVERTVEHVCTSPLDVSRGRAKGRFDFSDPETPRTIIQVLEVVEGTELDVTVKTARGDTLPANLTITDNRGNVRDLDDELSVTPSKGRIRVKGLRLFDTSRYTLRVDVDPQYTGKLVLTTKVRLDRNAYDSTRYISGTGTLRIWALDDAKLDVTVKPVSPKGREADEGYVDDPVVVRISGDDGSEYWADARVKVKGATRRYRTGRATTGGVFEIEMASAGDPEAIGQVEVRVRIIGATRYGFSLPDFPVGADSPGGD